jgi:hypothetical protein
MRLELERGNWGANASGIDLKPARATESKRKSKTEKPYGA